MEVVALYSQTVEEFAVKTMEDVCKNISEKLSAQMLKLVGEFNDQHPAPTTLVFNNRETVLGNLRAVATMFYNAAVAGKPATLLVEVMVNDRLVVIVGGTSDNDELTYQLATNNNGALDVTLADILLIKMAVENIG